MQDFSVCIFSLLKVMWFLSLQNCIECFLELDQKYVQLVCLVLSCYLYAQVLSVALGLLFYSSGSMLHIDAENVIGTLFQDSGMSFQLFAKTWTLDQVHHLALWALEDEGSRSWWTCLTLVTDAGIVFNDIHFFPCKGIKKPQTIAKNDSDYGASIRADP